MNWPAARSLDAVVTKERIVAAAPSALPAAGAVLGLVVLGVGGFFLFRAVKDLPGEIGEKISGAAKEGAQQLATGTGDFFSGVFGGNDPIETPISAIRTIENPDAVFFLTDPALRDPQDPLFNPVVGGDTERTLIVQKEGDELVVVQTGGSISTPAPDFIAIEDPSIAQDFGAAVGGLATGLFTEPFFGSLGGPSIQDTVGGIKTLFGRLF